MRSIHPKKCFQMTHRLVHAQQLGVTVLCKAEGRKECRLLLVELTTCVSVVEL